MQFGDTLFGTVKNGVLVLSGYVSNVTVEHGSLLIRDGIKGSVVARQFGRAYCPISRLISTQSEGYISFSAVRWLHAVGASVAHLNFDGTPLLVSVPGNTVLASLRRRQAVLPPIREAVAIRRRLAEANPPPVSSRTWPRVLIAYPSTWVMQGTGRGHWQQRARPWRFIGGWPSPTPPASSPTSRIASTPWPTKSATRGTG